MRMNAYLILGIMLSGSLLAQQATNPSPPPIATPAADAAVTNVPPTDTGSTNAAPKKQSAAKKKSPKKSVAKKKPGAELKTVPLVPGPASVEANHVNVRGQPKLNSEVVARLTKDQKVTVIEEITRKNSGPDEPSAWAKIALPSDVHVWVNSSYIDSNNKTVKSKKLNFRSGPGENFSVLGRLQRGDVVNQVSAKAEWLEIEAPTNAYAFVAAQYLKQEAPAPATPIEPPPVATAVTSAPGIAAAPTETSTTAVPAEPLPTTSKPSETAASAITQAPPAVEEPPPRRIVQREGIVRGTTSIQAPTHFELMSPENKRTIDYLYTTSPYLDLSRYKGLRIVVSGEEGLEERWGNTPVITIEKIQVLE
jgi:SH3-like domain-containing protein